MFVVSGFVSSFEDEEEDRFWLLSISDCKKESVLRYLIWFGMLIVYNKIFFFFAL